MVGRYVRASALDYGLETNSDRRASQAPLQDARPDSVQATNDGCAHRVSLMVIEAQDGTWHTSMTQQYHMSAPFCRLQEGSASSIDLSAGVSVNELLMV